MLRDCAELTLVAVLEELIWRGWILGTLRARYGVPIAVAASSALFGLAHAALLAHGAAAAPVALKVAWTSFCGVFFAGVLLASRNYWMPIVAHAAMWGRIRSIHFACKEPALNLRLSNTAGDVARLVWETPASDSSAAGARQDLPHWFRWSLLPCNLFFSLVIVVIALWLPAIARQPSASAHEQQARAEAERKLDEYVKARTSSPEEAEALKEELLREASKRRPDRTWLWPVLGLAAVVVLAATGAFRFVASLWGRLFPAAYWDFPAQAHVFATESARLWVLRIALILLLMYYGVSWSGVI